MTKTLKFNLYFTLIFLVTIFSSFYLVNHNFHLRNNYILSFTLGVCLIVLIVYPVVIIVSFLYDLLISKKINATSIFYLFPVMVIILLNPFSQERLGIENTVARNLYEKANVLSLKGKKETFLIENFSYPAYIVPKTAKLIPSEIETYCYISWYPNILGANFCVSLEKSIVKSYSLDD